MNQESLEGMIHKGRGKYLALATVGLMVAIGIMNTRNQTESPAELRRKQRSAELRNPAETDRKGSDRPPGGLRFRPRQHGIHGGLL